MTSNWNAKDAADLGSRRTGLGMTLPQVAVTVILILCAGVLVVRHVEPAEGQRAAELRGAADRALARAMTIPAPDVPAADDAARRRATLALDADAALRQAGPGVVQRTDVRGETRLLGDVEGLLVVHPGARLVLEDVVLRGSIVSAGANSGHDAGDGPRIVVRGTLRIDPSSVLPDVAVLVPEGVLVAEGADSSVQIRGDVVCRAVRLAGSGSVLGRLDVAAPPQLSPRIAVVDDARLAANVERDRRLAAANVLASMPDTDVSWDEVTTMTSFEFPAERRR